MEGTDPCVAHDMTTATITVRRHHEMAGMRYRDGCYTAGTDTVQQSGCVDADQVRTGRWILYLHSEEWVLWLENAGKGEIRMGKESTKLIANNKKAYHDYFIEDTYEAGIALSVAQR